MPIAWLDEARCSDPLHVGGKAASLARLAAQYRVPPAFAVTTAAFSRWGDARNSSAGEPAPAEMHEVVTAAYGRLADQCADSRPAVAVRSSAVDEDGPAASFAGQHETFLNIVGAEAVVDAALRDGLRCRRRHRRPFSVTARSWRGSTGSRRCWARAEAPRRSAMAN